MSPQPLDPIPDTTLEIEDDEKLDIFPDGGFGWVTVFASFMVHIYAIGLPTSFGIYQEAYRSAPPFTGTYSTLAITFIGSCGNAGLGLVAIPAGRLVDLFGPQLMCAIGAVIMCVSLLAASYSTEYWQFLCFQGILFGIGCSIAYFPALTILSHYFQKRKGLATGIAVSGSGIGGFIIAPLTRWLISTHGIPISLRIHSIAAGVIVFSCALLLKPRLPRSIKGSMNYIALIKDARFIRLFFIAVLASFGYFVPFFFIPSFGIYYGLSASQVALVVGITNGASAFGRIALGYNADLLGHLNTFFACMLTASMTVLFIWPFAQTYVLLVLFGILYGCFIGGFISLFPTAIQQLFGNENVSSITGMVYSGFFFGNLFGSPVAGAILDALTVVRDGVKEIQFIPVILLPGITLFLSSLLILNVKLIVSKKLFAKI